MALPEPNELRARFAKRGREELAQRMLSSLILGSEPLGWNKRQPATPDGLELLGRLDERCFGERCAPCEQFVDEFELIAVDPDKPAGWPDYATLSAGRLLIIELKTERGSHRPGQLDYYFALGRHHHPDVQLDQIYVTPSMTKPPPVIPEGARFAHITWDDVAALVEAVWDDDHPDPDARRLARALVELLATLEQPASSPPAPVPSTPERVPVAVDGAPVEMAEATFDDHQQRALDIEFDTPEEMESFRLRLRDQLRDHPTIQGHVRPWIWREASTGTPLTSAGARTGYEIRLSYYR